MPKFAFNHNIEWPALSTAKLLKEKKEQKNVSGISWRSNRTNRQWFFYISKKWHFDDEFLNSCNQRSGRIKLCEFSTTKNIFTNTIGFGVIFGGWCFFCPRWFECVCVLFLSMIAIVIVIVYKYNIQCGVLFCVLSISFDDKFPFSFW